MRSHHLIGRDGYLRELNGLIGCRRTFEDPDPDPDKCIVVRKHSAAWHFLEADNGAVTAVECKYDPL